MFGFLTIPFAPANTSPVVIVSPVTDFAKLVIAEAVALTCSLLARLSASFARPPIASITLSDPAVLKIIPAPMFPNYFPSQPAEKASPISSGM